MDEVVKNRIDARVIPRWLSDDEICRIKANDEIEINRRGIPRWR